MRFYDPDSGYITIDGVPTREMKRADVRALFGMVLQDTWLFSGTIEENLRYGNQDATLDDIKRAAKACDVHHVIESLPKGYQTVISEDSDNISAGEKQLLTIARAIVANTPMIILDEATSALDTESEKLVQEALENLMKDRTTLVVAHRLSTIRNADLICVLHEGHIVETGTHDTLYAISGGYYRRLIDLQNSDTSSR
jgi:ABC-type multidrug transport system fused ATPase/permease subunit